ncbi:MAG: DEAD/DEAH box helicase family protein [Prevotella sp.]|nr:DEAD/DEAH box helicase family protein [Staphylococcus sp.]MCM1350842.1 DEAD/DEAH box helicase family protein [Prevotella sp.]
MMDFSNVKFKGVFRVYQQRVLDHSNEFLKDNKINIVAAPGSGKTILGLELIKRLNSPCIILSPTTTIRQQWGQRFNESFLEDTDMINEYVSYNLNDIKLLNSITYQALYSAINKIASSTKDEEIDYSNIELFHIIKENNIKTICLDEAHHLQNEWQKALDKFIKGLSKDIKVISLTATPPYDANPTEWNRYISTCGIIDDEIFVSELVKENTLCPHQDYVILNYPTQKEIESFQHQRSNAYLAISEIGELSCFSKLNNRISDLYNNKIEYVYEKFAEIVALMIFLNHIGYTPNKKIFYKLTNSRTIPYLNKKFAERSIQFLLNEDFIIESQKEDIKLILKKYSLIERKKVTLDLTEKLKRNLISSAGKLTSISKIVKSEYENLQKDLRMLVLTDYIKKDTIHHIGRDIPMDSISIVSIFEELRKNNSNILIGCLSGSLVILPNLVIDKLETYGVSESEYKTTILENTDYSIIHFRGSNREKVEIVSKIFESGHISVLIGTQSLLGEGWDSPCINSLILSSYVGSFMLSNQMRGRAIRTYQKNPNKTANIWHLVTLEPEYVFEDDIVKKIALKIQEDKKNITSYDYQTLCRRFECFVGPNYDTGEIESGIERLTYIKGPYTQSHIEEINKMMFKRSQNREGLIHDWNHAIAVTGKTVIENKVIKEVKIPTFTYQNILGLITAITIQVGCISFISNIGRIMNHSNITILVAILTIFIMILVLFFMRKILVFIVKNSSPKKSIKGLSKAILSTLQEMKLVHDGAKLNVISDDLDLSILVSLNNATIYEQNIFHDAIKELLSPIENPRYVIIKKNNFGQYVYKYSFACPTIIGKDGSGANILNSHLKSIIGNMEAKYVYSDLGRKIILQCKKKSFISKNANAIRKRYKVSKFE